MVALNALQSYYEFTSDPRVLELMQGVLQWELALPEELFLPPFWQQQRASDNIASVYWLYNRTGQEYLLQLPRRSRSAWPTGPRRFPRGTTSTSPSVFGPRASTISRRGTRTSSRPRSGITP